MKTLLVAGALVTLAASAHALVIDDFRDGAFDSGYQAASSGGWGTQVSASVMTGSRYASVSTNADPNGEDFRFRVNTAQKMFMVSNGIGVDGVAALQYYGTPYNADLSATPVVELTFQANDLPNKVTLFFSSNTLLDGAARTLTIPALSAPTTFSFDFSGENVMTQVTNLDVTFDYAPSGDFTLGRIEAVPEPLTLAVLASGVAMLGARRRRKS